MIIFMNNPFKRQDVEMYSTPYRNYGKMKVGGKNIVPKKASRVPRARFSSFSRLWNT